MSDNEVHTLLLVVDCRIPQVHTLKEKRSVIKRLTEKFRSKLNASIAETGCLDEWQRSILSIAMVSSSTRYLQQQLARVEQLLLEVHEISVIKIEQHWI
jgi:uncharacterized protein YlxP (DUF503 family)